MFKVHVRWANGSISEFVLHKDAISLGRAPESDVFLSSESASRAHAVVFVKGDQVFIEDQQSSNGTYVKNERIKLPTEITSNDPVKLGDIYIRVTYEDPNAKPKFLQPAQSTAEYSIAQKLGDRRRTVAIGGDMGAELRKMFSQQEATITHPAYPKKK